MKGIGKGFSLLFGGLGGRPIWAAGGEMGLAREFRREELTLNSCMRGSVSPACDKTGQRNSREEEVSMSRGRPSNETEAGSRTGEAPAPEFLLGEVLLGCLQQ